MGTRDGQHVSGALGIGIYCNDRSMCMIEHNTVVGTRPDTASGNPTRRGFGVLASFQSQADLRGNQLSLQPGTDGRRHRLADPRDALTQREGTVPHIDLPEGVPESGARFAFRPETARPLCDLAEVSAPRREHA